MVEEDPDEETYYEMGSSSSSIPVRIIQHVLIYCPQQNITFLLSYELQSHVNYTLIHYK